jgi:hypothetical protein
MLVCYESILTGESRAFCSDTIYAKSSNGLAEKVSSASQQPLLEKREKWRTRPHRSGLDGTHRPREQVALPETESESGAGEGGGDLEVI